MSNQTEPVQLDDVVGVELDQDDYIAGGLQGLVILLTVIVICDTWFRSPIIRDKHVKRSLLVYHALNIITMSQGSICIWQILSPSSIIYKTNEFSYGITLSASYMFFFAKQKSITKNTLDFFDDSFATRHRLMEKAFFATFAGYVLFVCLFPVFDTVHVDEETNRVSYDMPVWMRVMIALGDTGISLICLTLFVAPVLEFSKSERPQNKAGASQAGKSTTIRKIAFNNAKMALIAIISTTLFFSLGSYLESSYWILTGCIDLLVNVTAVRYMFVVSKKSRCCGDSSENTSLLSGEGISNAEVNDTSKVTSFTETTPNFGSEENL